MFILNKSLAGIKNGTIPVSPVRQTGLTFVKTVANDRLIYQMADAMNIRGKQGVLLETSLP